MPSGHSDTLSFAPPPARIASARRLGLWLAGMLRPQHWPVPLDQLALPQDGMTKGAVRALATAVPMGDALLCRALGRYKMLLDAADNGFAPHLALDGYWEWWTTSFLARQLRPGQRVIEAGAGYGYFTLLMADRVGPAGQVTAFEPHPRLAALLRRNLELNGLADRVRLHQVALGDAPQAAASLLMPERAPLASRLLARKTSDVPHDEADHQIVQVSQQALDRLAEEPVDWVRLDLPGSAEALWAGMQRLLESQPAVRLLMGFDPARASAPADFVEALERRFSLRRLEQDGLVRGLNRAEVLNGGVQTLYLARSG